MTDVHLPSLPQIRVSSPIGKLNVKSRRTNLPFRLGVVATDGPRLRDSDCLRSWGQVTVALLTAILIDHKSSESRGRTGDTSALERYFSIRRTETKP